MTLNPASPGNFSPATPSGRRGSRAVATLTASLVAGGLALVGANASAASTTPSNVHTPVATEHGPSSAEPKWHPGAPYAGSEIADAETLSAVPAAPAEAPPTAIRRAAATEQASDSAEPKWHPGAPDAGSEIADAKTLATVPALPAQAPPAVS